MVPKTLPGDSQTEVLENEHLGDYTNLKPILINHSVFENHVTVA